MAHRSPLNRFVRSASTLVAGIAYAGVLMGGHAMAAEGAAGSGTMVLVCGPGNVIKYIQMGSDPADEPPTEAPTTMTDCDAVCGCNRRRSVPAD